VPGVTKTPAVENPRKEALLVVAVMPDEDSAVTELSISQYEAQPTTDILQAEETSRVTESSPVTVLTVRVKTTDAGKPKLV
jgi:hypothetical protein